MPDEVDELITNLSPPTRVLTTNDGTLMVPVQWVNDLATIYHMTAESALRQETREDSDRYTMHVKTISQAVQRITGKMRSKAG